ncbi:ATP-binding cassette domain-containing protein [Streptomyces werraensis]|nr:ATP-binding cassette domain-containing protein [Streptomyces werraensis]
MARIRNARERVQRLTAEAVAPPPEPLAFTPRLAAPGTVPEAGAGAVPEDLPAAHLSDVRVGDRLRLGSLTLGRGGRLLVTGPNGAGKTTLLKVLAGELRPDQGTVRVPGRVGHLRQEETPWPPGLTLAEAFGLGRVGSPDEHADALLALGLFRPADLRLRVGELSYGQRRRVDLARLVTEPADLLLLDEPTNHLSPALVEQLEEALSGYPGGDRVGHPRPFPAGAVRGRTAAAAAAGGGSRGRPGGLTAHGPGPCRAAGARAGQLAGEGVERSIRPCTSWSPRGSRGVV